MEINYLIFLIIGLCCGFGIGYTVGSDEINKTTKKKKKDITEHLIIKFVGE